MPPGWRRLAWRAGGAWLIARQALTVYRPGRALLFAVAAGVAAWTAWPDSSAGHAAAGQFGVIATVLAAGRTAVAGTPVLRAGPGEPDGPVLARRRYAAILALMPALAVVGPFPGTVPQRGAELPVFYASGNSRSDLPGTSSGGPPWQGEIFLLILMALST